MTFYNPPFRRPEKINHELLILVLGLLLLLCSFLLAMHSQMPPRERPALGSTLAVRSSVINSAEQHSAAPASAPSALKMAAPIKARLAVTRQNSSLELALAELLKGPSAQEIQAGHYSEIPKGTQLLGVTVKDNVVTVNLSKQFTEGGGSTSMLGRVAALRKTVTDINKNYKLRIAILGKPVEYIGGEGLEVSQ